MVNLSKATEFVKILDKHGFSISYLYYPEEERYSYMLQEKGKSIQPAPHAYISSLNKSGTLSFYVGIRFGNGYRSAGNGFITKPKGLRLSEELYKCSMLVGDLNNLRMTANSLNDPLFIKELKKVYNSQNRHFNIY